MDFKKIYEAKEEEYDIDGFVLEEGDDTESSKKNFIKLLKHIDQCLGEAAEYGKAISYFQDRVPVEMEGHYDDDGELNVPYTDEEKAKLDDYEKRHKEYHDRRVSQHAERLDYEIYDIRDTIQELLERAKKIED